MASELAYRLPTAEQARELSPAAVARVYGDILNHQLAVREDGLADAVRDYRGQPLAFIMKGLRQLRGPSWRVWRIVLKAAYGYPLDEDELPVFRTVAGGRDPPGRRVKELWALTGARGGKDSVASTIAANAACYASDGVPLRPGEQILIPCFAVDRKQAQIIYNYTKAYFELPGLRNHVIGELTRTPQPIQLDNDVQVVIATNNFRAPRGWPIACAIFDEVAFWRSEESATPDVETYTAVLRGMGTIPNAMLVGITTVYRQKGLAFDKWHRHFGKDDPDVLVIVGDTRTFNPTFDQSVIDRHMAEDPEKAGAEYYARWRRDLADYVDRAVAEAAVDRGRVVTPRIPGVRYEAFVDPSGGSVDSMALAVAHREKDLGVLDCLDEVRAPFAPSEAVARHAAVLKSYGLIEVYGDRYAGEWPAEAFAKHGITYKPAEATKSDIYRDFLPFLNSGRIRLLDLSRLVGQLCRLERRTARGGRDTIDHPQNEHDDAINAAAGALLRCVGEVDPVTALLRSMGH